MHFQITIQSNHELEIPGEKKWNKSRKNQNEMISAKRKSLTEGGYDPHLSTHLSGCILIKNFQNS